MIKLNKTEFNLSTVVDHADFQQSLTQFQNTLGVSGDLAGVVFSDDLVMSDLIKIQNKVIDYINTEIIESGVSLDQINLAKESTMVITVSDGKFSLVDPPKGFNFLTGEAYPFDDLADDVEQVLQQYGIADQMVKLEPHLISDTSNSGLYMATYKEPNLNLSQEKLDTITSLKTQTDDVSVRCDLNDLGYLNSDFLQITIRDSEGEFLVDRAVKMIGGELRELNEGAFNYDSDPVWSPYIAAIHPAEQLIIRKVFDLEVDLAQGDDLQQKYDFIAKGKEALGWKNAHSDDIIKLEPVSPVVEQNNNEINPVQFESVLVNYGFNAYNDLGENEELPDELSVVRQFSAYIDRDKNGMRISSNIQVGVVLFVDDDGNYSAEANTIINDSAGNFVCDIHNEQDVVGYKEKITNAFSLIEDLNIQYSIEGVKDNDYHSVSIISRLLEGGFRADNSDEHDVILDRVIASRYPELEGFAMLDASIRPAFINKIDDFANEFLEVLSVAA